MMSDGQENMVTHFSNCSSLNTHTNTVWLSATYNAATCAVALTKTVVFWLQTAYMDVLRTTVESLVIRNACMVGDD